MLHSGKLRHWKAKGQCRVMVEKGTRRSVPQAPEASKNSPATQVLFPMSPAVTASCAQPLLICKLLLTQNEQPYVPSQMFPIFHFSVFYKPDLNPPLQFSKLLHVTLLHWPPQSPKLNWRAHVTAGCQRTTSALIWELSSPCHAAASRLTASSSSHPTSQQRSVDEHCHL